MAVSSNCFMSVKSLSIADGEDGDTGAALRDDDDADDGDNISCKVSRYKKMTATVMQPVKVTILILMGCVVVA